MHSQSEKWQVSTINKYFDNKKIVGRYAGSLPSMWEAMGSIPSTSKRKKMVIVLATSIETLSWWALPAANLFHVNHGK
jgi:hypothetical protein